MKHVISLRAVTKPFDGYWMKYAYRIPVGKFPAVARFISQETDVNTPITELMVNSLISSHPNGAAVKAGPVTVAGIAWDGGHGIRAVEVSIDGGNTWSPQSWARISAASRSGPGAMTSSPSPERTR
jgi:sulfite dehydrogenase